MNLAGNAGGQVGQQIKPRATEFLERDPTPQKGIFVPMVALSTAEPLGCPLCGVSGVVREFLSLAPPTRPARVVVRVRT